MSQENVDNVVQAVEAFNRQDADAFVALASPNVEWEDAIFWSEGVRVFRGREELRQWISEVSEPWGYIHVRIEEIAEAPDDGVFFGVCITGRGKGSGVEAPALHVWQVVWLADGRTERRQVFRERAEALEAAGLSE